MSIQPVNKAGSIRHQYWRGGKKKAEKKRAVNAYLIKNNNGGEVGAGGGGGGALSQAVGRIGRSIMSQSILCNYFKVCTKFTLERAE